MTSGGGPTPDRQAEGTDAEALPTSPMDELRKVVLGFVNPLPVVTYVADPKEPKLYFVSAEIRHLLGYSRAEWLRDHELRVSRVHPEDRYRVLQERAQARAEAQTFFSEYRLLARSGATVWVRDQATLQTDDTGILSPPDAAPGTSQYWWGLVVDITEQRLAEEDLRVRAAQQTTLATLSQRALETHDRAKLFREAAELLAETLGMDRALVVRRDRPSEPLRVEVAAPPLAAGQVEVPAGSVAHRALDDSAPVWVTDRRYAPDDGAPVGHDATAAAAVAIDCPGQEKAVLVVESSRPRMFTREDARLLQWVADVLANALARLATEAQLGQAMKISALGRLAAGVAHDFNNIIAAIQGFGTLLEPAVVEDERARRHLGELQAAAQRATALVDQLLAFSREQTPHSVPVRLNDLVAGMEAIIGQVIGPDIELRHERSDSAPVAHADPHQIEQVLLNLIVNACDAMPEGGRITVRTCTDVTPPPAATGEEPASGPYVALEVEDEGTGMDPETVEKVFEPFFTTKAATEGTGLGLSTVLGIARRHGGTVTIDTELGRGTCFTVYLPAEEAPATTHPAEEGPTSPELDDGPTSALATIAVVDDQEAIRTVVRELLVQRGYAVVVAEHAEDYLDTFRRAPAAVDLVLTDVTMPGMGGPALARRLWELRPALPVIYMSGYADAAGEEIDRARGRTVVLRKPFSVAELLEAVERALASA